MIQKFTIGSDRTQITEVVWSDDTEFLALKQAGGDALLLSQPHMDRLVEIWREIWDADKHEAGQRLNAVFALKEFSYRNSETADFQIGGIHFDPPGATKTQPKIQVTHATQQRIYAATAHAMDLLERAEKPASYDDAWDYLVDMAKLGMMAMKYNPRFCAERLNNAKTITQAETAEDMALRVFPGAKV